MLGLRINCLDIMIFSAVAYAASDLIANWTTYQQCSKPLHIWLLVSYVLTITFRFLHFAGHVLSFRSMPSEEGEDFNWNRAQALRTLSYVIILIVFPAFTFWGVIGTVWFMDANDSTGNCFTDFEEYSFIIFWLIVTYIWIIAYVLLLALTALTYYRGLVMKRSLVAFLRKIDFEDNDLFESTRTNIMEEN